jgi:hypothetical protein
LLNDSRIYRWAGAAGLASIAVFFIEFPLYFVRGAFPPKKSTSPSHPDRSWKESTLPIA